MEQRHGGKGQAMTAMSVLGRSGYGLALAAALLGSGPAEAGNYTLTYGKQFEVCRAFAENLTSFGDLPERLNEWPLNPKLKKFRKPAWISLDPKEHLPLIEHWVRSSLPGQALPDSALGNQLWQELHEQIDGGRVFLGRASIDIDNDNRPETVYRLNRPSFQYPSVIPKNIGWHYILIDSDTGQFDKNGRSLSRRLHDSFYYDGRYFLARGPWPEPPSAVAADLTIVELSKPRPTGGFAYIPVCSFGYAPRREP